MNRLLLPVIAVQGVWVRRHIEVLPEASGPSTGIATETSTGTTTEADRAPLRLTVVGESTAAGCGAQSHEEAFAGAFARSLADRRGRPVTWTVHGRSGATIRRVRYRILPDLGTDADVAVLLIGVNDVLNRTPATRWREDVAAVVDALTARATHVVVTGIPPFESFPSLPRALREHLAQSGLVLDDIARELCSARPDVSWIDSTDLVPVGEEFFARDGFHPSPAGYQRWAHAVSERLPDWPQPQRR